MNHFELNDDGSAERLDWNKSVDAQAKALGWMLDNLDKPNNPVYADSTKAEQGLRDIEAMFMARNKEACVMEQGIVEALYWLDDGAQGKAHSVLTEVLAKLSAMRVKL